MGVVTSKTSNLVVGPNDKMQANRAACILDMNKILLAS